MNNEKITMKLRLMVWNSILKTKELKKQFNYQKERDKTISTAYDRYSNCPFSIIDLDVQRTQFDDNVEESRKNINNVLKTVATLLPEINYCQGMNFIAAFLYRISKSEEQTFYLMLGLLKNTKFSKIFYNELKKLKLYFSAFEKILTLYLPIVSSFLKTNSIMANYYSSAWFITLFTSSMVKNTKLDGLVKIWDNFLLKGWKCIFNTGLILLEMSDEKLLTLRNEALMTFLSNGITQNLIFEDFSLLLQKLKKFKIKNKLIHNIKNEIKHEEQLTEEND